METTHKYLTPRVCEREIGGWGGGSEITQICVTSFMNGPLPDKVEAFR